jgi:hypothetical protein
MKKILVQLDTDQHPSAFDAIAAYDADVDIVLGFGAITPENLADLVQGAMFPRGPDGLANTAFWVGGSNVRDGEAVFEGSTQVALLKRGLDELVAWLFKAMDFPVGAVLLTGTSVIPELTLQAGDEVRIAITGLGELVNTVEVV